MTRRLSPLALAGVAVAAALVVAGVWCGRARAPVAESALSATVGVRITRHDALGMPSKPTFLRDPARVRALVEALGIDRHEAAPCPPDYASAGLGLLLTGRDVYARRNVYLWGAEESESATTPAEPRVVTVTSSGCRAGAPADTAVLRRELRAAGLPDAGSPARPPL